MTKEIFDLQLFADENPAAEAQQNEEPAAEAQQEQKQQNEAKYTDDDVNKLLNRKFAEWQKQQDKKITEAERLSKMTAEEKAAERMKALEDKLKGYEEREAKSAMTKQARAILQDKNVNVSDELLANLIAEDADATKASVESFLKLFNSAVEKAVKEALKGEAPKAGGTATMTKEQIMAITNRAERQRLMKENYHLFQ